MQADDQLSHRELEVLGLLASGATNAQIAAQLALAEEAVKSHVKQILEKLGVRNRGEAALRYVQLYGPRSSRLDPSEAPPGTPAAPARHPPGSGRPGSGNEHKAEVVGVSGRHVHVRLADGRAIEIPLVEEIGNRLELGSPALIYFDDEGTLMGWYLPDAGIGVDMRGDCPPSTGSD
jgi:DNA-binding CsgD family transcriptional regulator